MRRTNLWDRFLTRQNLGASRQTRFIPHLCRLERRDVPNGYMAIGAGPGALPLVAIRVDIQDQILGSPPNGAGQPATPQSDGKTDFTSQVFAAYNTGFRGGVHVATGNFDGNPLTPDSLVTAAGPGGGPHVIIWNTQQNADGTIVVTGIRQQFMAFDPRFIGGVNITCGDLDGDGRAELICAAGPGGGPDVRIYSPDATGQLVLVHEFFAYAASFRGGVTVASGQGYNTPVQLQQDVNQFPAAVTPYPAGQPVPGAAQGLPLVGFDPNTFFPAITVGGGNLQYLSANLLNSYGQIAYRPNIFIPPLVANPTNQGNIVYANWADMTAASNYPTDGSFPPTGVTVGPYVQLGTTAAGTPVITRLTPPTGQVTTRNQLITGPGPGGGPDVRVWGFTGTGPSLFSGLGNEFFAFDPNFRGGVNVGIGDVISSPLPANFTGTPVVEPGTIDQTTGFVNAETTVNSSLQQNAARWPFDPNFFRLYTPEIIVTMQTGGSSARIFADFNPLVTDPLNVFSGLAPAQRANIQSVNFVPALVDRMVAANLGDPLNNFNGLASTTVFNRGIAPQFTGGLNPTVAAFTFGGSARPVATGFSQSLTAPFGPPISPNPLVPAGANPVLGQSVFAAGSGPSAINFGSEVQIFNQMSEIALPPLLLPPIPPSSSPLYNPIDSFFGITNNGGAVGASVSFGFGALPIPTIDRLSLAVITPTAVSNPILV
jgi:hypothetical protein